MEVVIIIESIHQPLSVWVSLNWQCMRNCCKSMDLSMKTWLCQRNGFADYGHAFDGLHSLDSSQSEVSPPTGKLTHGWNRLHRCVCSILSEDIVIVVLTLPFRVSCNQLGAISLNFVYLLHFF